MKQRKLTKKINIGTVEIGGNAPISVQSMCNTDTRNVKATVRQINELTDAGCELIRVAVLDKEAAQAIGMTHWQTMRYIVRYRVRCVKIHYEVSVTKLA